VSRIKIVCAWCEKDMGEKDGGGVEGVSHGICEECLRRQLDALERLKKGGESDEQGNQS